MGKAEVWARVGADAQRVLDDAVIAARSDLLAAGFPAKGHRFPFALHHTFYRSRIRIGGRKTTHSEIAVLLNAWAAVREDRTDYARQAVCGAVKHMLTGSPALVGRIPSSVRESMGSVGDGYEFRKWAAVNGASLIAAIPPDVVPDKDERVDMLIDAVSGYRAA